MIIDELTKKVSDGEEITAWVEFKPDVHIELAYISPKEMDRIRKRCGRKKIGRTGEYWEYNEEKFRAELSAKVIKDWKGFENSDGTPYECTDENKKKLCDAWAEFLNWVLDNISEIDNFFENKGEMPLKTSESGEDIS